ncbi:serine protease [Butyrivibrio sp. X503]|uniref:S1C family serine protease n=1 Tax=Butyrivibrio sp. X503 TaxID=2364878 RepID=UPI000EA87107|nr:S1C family serine protease [Butyrivibrio sp. X503]RKM54727.1 serine protease [Butyrivibrio sp. X503]
MPTNPEENKKDTSFISEKIKQRPINRKKLLRRTIITISLAVVFGIVACLTFLVLQPVFNDTLYPESSPEKISFPEETVNDELSPEEMFADDNEIAASEAMSLEEDEKNKIDEALASYSFSQSDYGKLMSSLKYVADEVNRSVVTVTSVTSDANWINDSYESSGMASGIIIADNGPYLYILAPSSAASDAKSIRVTFCDNSTADATLSLMDTVTNQCVILVKKTDLEEHTTKSITTASLGSSNSGNLAGLPVIAVGSPMGIQGSISYGIITSDKSPLNLVDSSYKLITTDINGSSMGSGVLVNLAGEVIGIIDMSYCPTDIPNHISAIGISELKTLIADLSNDKSRPYMGIHGATVPIDFQHDKNVPAGAYITQIEMNSPAMRAGLQSGDIIVRINDYAVNSYEQFVSRLAQCSSDDIITVTVMRQAPNNYIEIEMEVTLTSSTHD